ncbi:MAG: hypothetical protein Q9208_005607 [Pyrenodesmia sp. 3 TL-2023]
MRRSYGDAVAALNTLQTNSAVIDSIRKAGTSLNTQAIPEMIEWCRRAGYEPADFDKLNAIHVAGTKGKGSTSAFASSILCQFLPSPTQSHPLVKKVGLYTSPHLRFIRERIRINNEPLSEETFARYFFETWDRLEGSARSRGEPTDKSAKPSYFRFLTLMAFHTYISEGVDTAIIECGIGGEYDSTNIIISPCVTGITSLGIDHTQLLGNTIEEIAWHKAGIMKAGAPAYTVAQPVAALDVLFKRAKEKSVSLSIVQEHHSLKTLKLGLEAPFQHTNASLAINLVSTYLQTHHGTNQHCPTISPTSLPIEFQRGCEEVRWPGRCEIRREKGIAWHIDAGHTLESIRLAASWFASCVSPSSTRHPRPPPNRPRVLLFNQQTRDAPALARALHSTLVTSLGTSLDTVNPFTHAVFCTNLTYKGNGYRPDLVAMNSNQGKVAALEVQKELRDTWLQLGGATEVEVKGTIEEAVRWVRDVAAKDGSEEVEVLVTGSVHLVGGFLEVLEGEKE